MDHSNQDPVRGKTLRFTFTDGPMASKSFEHVFEQSGAVSYRADDEKKPRNGKGGRSERYVAAELGPEQCAVSYLGEGGYTLTTILDFRTGLLVAFSSNERGVSLQHGKFEIVESDDPADEAGPPRGKVEETSNGVPPARLA